MIRSKRLVTKFGIAGSSYLALSYLHPQRAADVRGIGKGLTNSFLAFPMVGYSVYEYIYGLRGLEYGTEAYTDKRAEIHVRVANRIKYLSNHCGGIYFKAG